MKKNLADYGKPLTREEMRNVKAGFSQAACTAYCMADNGGSKCWQPTNNMIECTCVYVTGGNCLPMQYS